MQLLGDFHTHTLYSHGRGTIEDNVRAAISKGLKQVAITDHGFRHTAYNVRCSDFPFMQREVLALRQKYPEIEILLGLETNIQGNNGRIDITTADLDKLDIIICGYHKYVLPPNPKQAFQFWVPTFFASVFHKSTSHRKNLNTQAFINAVHRYPIDIISHPKYDIDLDVIALAKEAKELGVYMELNGKKISMNDKEICGLVDTGVKLIIDSDAHKPEDVGDVRLPLSVIDRLHIPVAQVANLDKLPIFRSQQERFARAQERAASPSPQ